MARKKKSKFETKHLLITGLALVLFVVGFTVVGITAKADSPSGTALFISENALNKLFGLLEDRVVEPEPELGAFPGPDLFGPVTVRDGFTQVPTVAPTTTGTGASATLVSSDLSDVEYHLVDLGGAVNTNFTYTLPASSTLQILPEVGSRKEVCWFLHASSSSSHKLIFAAGTGIDIRQASSTGSGVKSSTLLQVTEGTEGCFEFVRQPRDPFGSTTAEFSGLVPGDVTAIWKNYEDSD